MGVRHRTLPIEGVQFHPESLFTEHGVDIVGNAVRGVLSRLSAEQVGAA